MGYCGEVSKKASFAPIGLFVVVTMVVLSVSSWIWAVSALFMLALIVWLPPFRRYTVLPYVGRLSGLASVALVAGLCVAIGAGGIVVNPKGGDPSRIAVPSALPTSTPVVTLAAQPTTIVQGNRPPSVSERGRIHVQSDQAFAATTQDNYSAFSRALTAHDQIGIADLISQRRLYLVGNGTLVLVLGHGGFLSSLTQVRVLEGAELGLSLWLPSEFLDRL